MPVPELTTDKVKATADGVDTIAVSNIPPGGRFTVYYIDGDEQIRVAYIESTSDTSVDLTFDAVGEYRIVLDVEDYNDGLNIYDAHLETRVVAV